MSLARAVLPVVVALTTSCDPVKEGDRELRGSQYNPCGVGVAPSDCPGGTLSVGGESYGTGLFANVSGSEGVHWLDVHSLGCTIEMDSTGTSVPTAPCPDCSLLLEMQHETAIDGCGVGPVTYSSLLGLVPADTGAGDYTVLLSLYEGDWYAVGGAVVENWSLEYDARTIYDAAYDYYGSEPSYTFTGEHALILNGMR